MSQKVITLSSSKGFAPIFLLFGIVIITVIAGGAYYFGKLPIKPVNNNPKACTQEAKSCPDGSSVGRTGPNCEFVPCPSVTPKPSDQTSDWRTFNIERCGFSIKYPSGWTVKTVNSFNVSNPEYNFPCVNIYSSDYQIFPQSDVFKGINLSIRRTEKGVVYKSSVKNINTTISNLDDYIKAENSSVEIEGGKKDYVQEVQDRSFGNAFGKYYISAGQGTPSNFIFEEGDYIYNATWFQNTDNFYENDLNQILSSFKFLDQVLPSKTQKDCAKLDSNLYQLSKASNPESFAASRRIYYKDGKVRAVIELISEGKDLTKQFDLKIESTYGNLMQALIPKDILCELSNDSAVRTVRIPTSATPD